MKTKIVFSCFILFFLITCISENTNVKGKTNLSGTIWISTNENYYGFTVVSFIDDKIAYIIMDTSSLDNEGIFMYFLSIFEDKFSYDNINVGTRAVSGKIEKKEWKFTYLMENENLTLNLPKELNNENYSTMFPKRLIGNNISQPIGLWTNDSGVYFLFTNSDSRKKFGMGTYVSWDYTYDDNNITWSGNTGSGTKPYVIDKSKGQIRLILPGNDFPIILTNVTNRFITIF
jgi:hypothetical protein